MAADITQLFKASVKTVRTRNKALGVGKENAKSNILNHGKHRTDFALKSREVVNTISKLKDFLIEHRKDYINASSHLSSEMGGMTDAERDQIDNDAQDFMRTCSESIRHFKADVFKHNMSPQLRSHRECVFELIDTYLKAACRIYSEQRAIRVKRVVDKKRISRLQLKQTGLTNTEPSTSTPLPKMTSTAAATELKNGDDNYSADTHRISADEDDEEDDLSPEEVQMFEQENQRMFNEMNCLVDEVRQIEGKVVEITKLQEIFADKVLQQEGDIDRIADTVVSTTENIKGANEDIREAIKNDAGFRVWILFFLLMCSFSLLFLDWYQ